MKLALLKRWFGKRPDKVPSKLPGRPSFFRPSLQLLEDRVLLAIVLGNDLLVNNPSDSHVANELSLREAISQANTDAANGISDMITFASGLAGDTIALTQGQLELSGSGSGTITIDGSSLSSPITISGGNAARVFQVDGNVQAVFTDFNISGGNAGSQLFGGGISNSGNLTLNDVDVSNSTAQYGGGISNGGTLLVNGGSFTTNSSTAGYGGAIFNSGTVTAGQASFTSNTSSGSGGAVLNFLAGSSFALSDCTFTDNTAVSGGAIDLDSSDASTLSGCSFTNNTASQTGGAIENSSSTLTITSSTFSGDTATQDGSGINANSGTITIEGPGWTNSETITATNGGTLDLYDNWENTGTISVDATSTIALGSPVDIDPTSSGAAAYIWTNKGTISIANGATVYLGSILTTDEYENNLQAFGVSVNLSNDDVYLSGTLDNSAADNAVSAGTLTVNSSTGGLTVTGAIYQGSTPGTIKVEGLPLTIEGSWSNEDAIAATGGAILDLYGSWSNSGAISVDASSMIGLGSPIAINPTSSGAANYAWTNTGTITIADGATVYLGGIFTTDTYHSNFQALGVSVDLAQDTVYLSGSMDNSAADNPASAGTLMLGSSTGPLIIAGGEIYQGTITTSGADILAATSAGATFDSVTLDGTLDLTQAGTVTALNGLDNEGTIELGDSTLNVNGDYTQGSAAALDIGIAGSSQYGQVLVSGNANLAGTLNLSLINDFTPQSGDAYEILTFSQANGAFGTVTGLGPFENGAVLTPVSSSTNVTVQANVPIPIYWTGDAGDNDWDNPGNWSLVDPLVTNTPQSVLPGPDNEVIVDLGFQTINHAQDVSETISDLIVTAEGVTLNFSAGTLDLSGSGGSGLLQADQPYDSVNFAGTLANATVSSGTTITATGDITILDALTLDGDIDVGGTTLSVESSNDSPVTIGGTGTIQLSSYQGALTNFDSAGLTLGPNLTVQAGDTYTYINAQSGPIQNEGTIDDTNGYYLYIADYSSFASFNNAGTVLIGPNATLEVFNSPDFYSGSGYGDYTQSAGTTTVDGVLLSDETYNSGVGPAAINGGVLDGTGTVYATTLTNAGIVNPGDGGIGTLTISGNNNIGNYSQTSAGTLAVDLAGSSQYGKLAVTGTAALAGTLAISTVNGFVPGASDQFVVLNFEQSSGNFSTTTGLGPYTNGLALSPSFTTTNLTLAPALPTLAITATTAPSSAVEGTSIPISWTVKNQSTSYPADALWNDAVYLSTKSTFDSSAIELTSVAAPPQLLLAPEASYTTNVSVTVPGGLPPGTNYYLLFMADANGAQAVTGASTLLVADPITIAAADLDITSVTSPAAANLGASIPVSWTVENTGDAPADSTWHDAVYLSSTSTLTKSATLLGAFAAPPISPLDVTGSYTLNENVTIPLNAATGAHYLLFVTDSDGGQVVSSTANAIDAVPITLDLTQLSVQSFTVPMSGQFSQAIPLSWTVTNNGTLPIDQSWSDEVYVSTKSTLDSSATLVATVPSSDIIPLAASASYTRNIAVTLPINVSATNGTYYVFLVVDATNQLAIANRSQTMQSQSIALTEPPLPDLVPTSLNAPGTGYNGQNVLVSWTDTNNGNATATGPWTDNIYLVSDARGDNATLVAEVNYPNSVAAGQQSVQLTQPIFLPSTPGTYYLEIVADASGINEGPNALNDTTIDPTPITVVQEALPDLVVTSIVPPTNVVAGTTVPVTYTVTNQGNAPTNAAQWLDAIFIAQSSSLTLSPTNDLEFGVGPPLEMPVLVDNPSYLLPGQSYSETVNVPFPYSASGTWYVYVATNRSFTHTPLDNFIDVGPVVESNAINDMTISAPFSVTLPPLPALTVARVETPPQAFSGQPLTVSWTVANEGPGIAIGQALQGGGAPTAPIAPTPPDVTTWTDEVFMSPDPTLNSNAIALGTFTHLGALSSGSAYSATQSVTLPVGVSGNFYFIVETDIYGQVFESGATAAEVNATPGAVTVNLTPPPDLKATIVSAPATALASHNLTFTYEVENVGAGPTALTNPNSSWVDSFYLSPTPTLNTSTALLLGQQTQDDIVLASSAYSNIITTTLPNGLAGNYYLIVDADSSDAVFELDETSKIGVSGSAIQISSEPADLVVSAIAAPSSGQAGEAVPVTWTVSNQGTGDSAVTTWADDIFADTGTTLGSNAVLVGSFTHTGLLNAGAFYSQSQMVTLPISLASGSYNLFVVTNEPVMASGETLAQYAQELQATPPPSPPVYESNYANDTSVGAPIDITQKLADLQATAVTATATAEAGSSVTVSWTVTNVGTGTTNSNYWYDDVWMSTSTTLGSGTDYYLGTLQHSNALGPTASYSASLAVAVPAGLTPGTYYFIVAVDRPVVPPSQDPTTSELVYQTSYSDGQKAAAGTMVTPGPNVVVSDVTAPTTLDIGQQLTASWTVTNNGSGGTGNVPINDSVYLSYDQVLSNSSIYLGTVTEHGGLAAGNDYTQNGTFSLPTGLQGTFYVFVVTDTNESVYEANPNDAIAFDPTPLVVQPTPPADLVAGTVTIPANAVPGEDITISYQVTNNGSNPANGSWTDTLYLSPTPSFNISDPLLGTVAEDRNLAPGASYTGSLTAPLPGVAPGSYYVVLVTNILDTIPETSLANNVSASLTQTSVGVPSLTLGTPATGTLPVSQSAYYAVTVGAGQTLEINLDTYAPDALNELYVNFGSIPTRGSAQYTFTSLAADQQITVPTTQAGTYYILAYANDILGDSESYSLMAALIPFAVQSVTPGQVGNAGASTLEIQGAQFDRDTSFELVGPGGQVIPATAVDVTDAATAYVTFDLAGAAVGAYGVKAVSSTGATSELAAGLNVDQGTGGVLQTSVVAPSFALAGSISTFTVDYANVGNADLGAPLLEVISPTNTPMGEDAQYVSDPDIYFLGTDNSGGPTGILRPGETENQTFDFQASATSGTPYQFQLEVYTTADTAPIDWSVVAGWFDSSNTSSNWPAILASLQNLVGPTWGDFVQMLDQNASVFNTGTGFAANNPLNLLELEVQKATAAINGSISGVLESPNLSTPVANLVVTAENNATSQVYTAVSNNEGSFILPTVSNGTYTITVGGWFSGTGGTVAVANGQPVTGDDVLLAPGGNISGQVINPNTNQPIAGLPVSLTGPGGTAFNTRTDSNGDYSFSDLAEGTYTVFVPLGGAGTSQTVTVTPADLDDGTETANLQLAYSAKISGQLLDSNGVPVTDGMVTLYQSGQPIAWAPTDDTGAYQFEVVSPGTFDLVATASEGTFAPADGIQVAAGSSVAQNFQTGDASLTVAASDNSQPAVGATVDVTALVEGGQTLLLQTNIGSNGSVQIPNFAPGQYTIIVVNGGDTGQQTITLSAGQSSQLTINLSAQAAIAGTVTDASGNPIDGAEVFIQLSSDLQQTYSTTTASDGTYSLSGITAGNYDVTIFTQGYLAATQTAISAAAGQVASVNAALAPCGTAISGTLVDPAGNAVPQGEVEILDALGHIVGLAAVQDNGTFDVTSAQGSNLSADVFAEGYAGSTPVSFDAQPSTTVQLNPIALQPVAIDQTEGLGTGGPLQPNPYATPLGNLYAVVTGTSSTPYEMKESFVPSQQAMNQMGKQGNNSNPPGAWSPTSSQGQNNQNNQSPYQFHFIQIVISTTYFVQGEPNTTPVMDVYYNGSQSSDPFYPALNLIPPPANGMITSNDTPQDSSFSWSIAFETFVVVTGGNISGMMVLAGFLWTVGEYHPTNWVGQRPWVDGADVYYGSAPELLSSIDLGLIQNALNNSGYNNDGKNKYKPIPFDPNMFQCNPTSGPDSNSGGGHRGGSGGGVSGTPHDPNYIIGPAGFATQNYISSSEVLPYQIGFENEPNAQLPAQQVVITEQLDSNLNWQSFRLGDFGFGGTTYTVPADVAFYQTQIDLTATDGYYVDVTATINEQTGVATWTFTTIDPATGQIPLNPTIGFLPPDNPTGVGEGFVSYTIAPKSSDPSGTVINAQATVDFYTQPPINTSEISNTIDAGTGLTSSASALPAIETASQFLVSWSGSDGSDGSGIAYYTIYVSDNGGPFTAWLTDTTLTSAIFDGQDGNTYSFYSVATDNTGNQQPVPSTAQATTTVQTVAPNSTVTALPTFSPATFTLSWLGTPGTSGSPIASYDIFVSDNGGGFTPLLTGTTLTSTSFTGQAGNTYSFYSVATDQADNVQATPPAAQASTTVEVAIAPLLVVTDNSGPYTGAPFTATTLVTGLDDTVLANDGASPPIDPGTLSYTYYAGTYTSADQLSGLTPLGGAPTTAGAYTVVALYTSDNDIYTSAASEPVNFTISLATPQVTVNPVTITSGTVLANSQLSGTAISNGQPVAGTFTYTTAAGTVPGTGQQDESVTFTPADTIDFNTVVTNVEVNVVQQSVPQVTVNPVNITYGTALDNSQLGGSATFDNQPVPGTFTYTTADGTVLTAGNGQTEDVTFTPTDTTDFSTVQTTVTVNVAQATPTVSVNPVNITYGTALTNTQLSGTASFTVNGQVVNVSGTLTYTTEAGTVLGAGNGQSEDVTFTANDATDYTTASTTVTINVAQATPEVSVNPVNISAGTPLANSQLSGTATAPVNGQVVNVPGTFTYTTAAGTVLGAGNGQSEGVTFTPTDTADYAAVQTTVTVNVSSNQAGTTTTLSSTANPAVFGQSVTLTAVVSPAAPGSGTPTGTVTFKNGGATLGTATLDDGQATLTTAALAVGTHSITVAYSGDGNFTTSTSAAVSQVVNADATVAVLQSSVNSSVHGQSVTLTATVTAAAPGAGVPTGTVTFFDGTTRLEVKALSDGTATVTTTSLPVGSDTLTVSYDGSREFLSSTSTMLTQVVNQDGTAVALGSSLSSSVFGQSVTLTATVAAVAPGAGQPTGLVTFLAGGTKLGTAYVRGGTATFKTTVLPVGTDVLTASYGGNSNFLGNTSTTLEQAVTQDESAVAVTSSVNPSVFGQHVTLTARVTAAAPGAGTPTGSVTFLVGGTPLATVTLTNGKATFKTTALAVGTDAITVDYSGDSNFLTSSSATLSQVVNQANSKVTVKSAANPAVFGEAVTLTATVTAVSPGSGTPTGTVTFFNGTMTLGTGTISGGVATLVTTSLPVGSNSISVVYGGDSNFAVSTSATLTRTVNQAKTKTVLASSTTSASLGSPVTVTATVQAASPGSGNPTGTVTFMEGSTVLAVVDLGSGDVASFTTSSLAEGTNKIRAVYSGDGDFLTSTSATLTVRIS